MWMNAVCHLKETNFQGQKGHSGTKDQILHCELFKQMDFAWSCPKFNPTKSVSVSEGTDFGQKKIETMGLLVYGLNH